MSNLTASQPTRKSVGPITFLKEVRAELSKVVWPSREETFRLTGLVVIVTVIVAVFVGGLDFLFTKLTETLILR
jgi:preprotein translocase subunit SecE